MIINICLLLILRFQGHNDIFLHCIPLRSYLQSSVEGGLTASCKNVHDGRLYNGKCAGCAWNIDVALSRARSSSCSTPSGERHAPQRDGTCVNHAEKAGHGSYSMAPVSCQQQNKLSHEILVLTAQFWCIDKENISHMINPIPSHRDNGNLDVLVPYKFQITQTFVHQNHLHLVVVQHLWVQRCQLL